MRWTSTAFTVGLFVMLTQTGCGSEPTNDASSRDDQPAAAAPQPPAAGTEPTPPRPATTSADGDAREIVGTIVRFSSNTTSVDVTIDEDNPAIRDFLSMLPLTHYRGVRGPRKDQLPPTSAQAQRLSGFRSGER